MGDRKIYIVLAVLVVISCFLIPLNGKSNRKAKAAVFNEEDGVPVIRLSGRMSASSSFEPSGLLWIDELKRYLVVSDDTGRGELSNQPVLFLMDARGNVDDYFIKIPALKEIRDLESITQDDEGFIYLMSSQVSGSSGRRKKARELMIKARLTGRHLTVVEKVHFLTILKRAVAEDRGLAAELGIDDVGELNVEGISFFGGKLYIGLDSPLDDEGRSLIWVLNSPSALFSEKRLDRSSLQLWARVYLSSFGKKQKDGIGDLLFTQGGDLILLSGRVEGGKVWRVSSPEGGILKPLPLRSFRNLNPEGAALSGREGHLFIVFDQGKNKSRWFEMKIDK